MNEDKYLENEKEALNDLMESEKAIHHLMGMIRDFFEKTPSETFAFGFGQSFFKIIPGKTATLTFEITWEENNLDIRYFSKHTQFCDSVDDVVYCLMLKLRSFAYKTN